MPDRIKNIEDRLNSMSGLGGGTTDVSSLATETTLAEVELNTGATTTALGAVNTGIADVNTKLAADALVQSVIAVRLENVPDIWDSVNNLAMTVVPATTSAVEAVTYELQNSIEPTLQATVTATEATSTGVSDLISLFQTKTLGTQLAGTDLGLISNSIIHGKTTAGTGEFIDVKVTPSGALAVEVGGGLTGLATETSLASVDTRLEAIGNLQTSIEDSATNLLTQLIGLRGELEARAYDTRPTLHALTRAVIPSEINATELLMTDTSNLRRALYIFNNSTASLYIGFNNPSVSSSTANLVIAPGGFYEMPSPVCNFAIYGVWSSVNGSATVTSGY